MVIKGDGSCWRYTDLDAESQFYLAPDGACNSWSGPTTAGSRPSRTAWSCTTRSWKTTSSNQAAWAVWPHLRVTTRSGRSPTTSSRCWSRLPIPCRVLQDVTNQAVEELATNPALARDLMSAGSYRHLVRRTGLADANYGKAVERLAADIVARDESLSSILRYQSRPFVSTPDFFGYEEYNLRLLDITTPNAIPRHLTRLYGPATDFITHPGLPSNLVFPR